MRRLLTAFIFLTIFSNLIAENYKIIVQNEYFPKPNKENEVYALRLQASEVLAKLGVPKGRVLKRVNMHERPYVMWECEYASMEERQKAVKLASQSSNFKKVEKKMDTLLTDFKRKIWEYDF